MKKKIDLFWYWFIFVVAFVLCFFAINNKKVNAYHLNDDGNLVSDNLFNINDSQFRSEKGFRVELANNKYYIYNADSSGRLIDFTLPILEKNKNYTLSLDVENATFDNIQMYFTNNIGSEQYQNGYTYQLPFTFNYNNIGNYKYVFCELYLINPVDDVIILDIMLNEGDTALPYEPFGVWYNQNSVDYLSNGVISFKSSVLSYKISSTVYTIDDVSSYIDSSFGFLYFGRLWEYLDLLTDSEYQDAWLTLELNNKMNLNTTYILNSMFNNGEYGVGAKFYSSNDLILNVTNWTNNDYAYCKEESGAVCSVNLSNFVNVGSLPGLQNSFTYFDKLEIWSGNTDKRTASFGFENISYNQGYNGGYYIGYKDGVSFGSSNGYDKGYLNGYNIGYDKGVNDVSNGGNTLVGLVGAVFTAPVNMLHTIFDFEFLGINLTNFLFSLISLFIVIWLIRKFL